MTETRADHIKWSKDRALQYVDAGDIAGALASFTSDMSKHPDTYDPDLMMLGTQLAMNGHLSTADDMRHWIEGFA